MTPAAVDLCAGPGGWDVAASALGIHTIGFEIDEAAILTRDAAGHVTVTEACPVTKVHPRGVRGVSMTEADPSRWCAALDALWRGLIASPPCQGFSMAGTGKAREDSARLVTAIYACRSLADVEALIADAPSWMSHEGTVLVLEPLRWALAGGFDWCAWEQVPAVAVIWHACAHVLRLRGWTVEVAVLSAEQYGVPQTRERAILVGRSARMTEVCGPAQLPSPTHSRYHRTDPTRLDPGVPKWVSMAEALGVGMTARPSMTVTGGGSETGGAEPFGHAPRGGMERERDAGRWTMGDRAQANGAVRDAEQSAPTLTGSMDNGNYRWAGVGPGDVTVRTSMGTPSDDPQNGSHELDPATRPAHVVTTKAASWTVTTGQRTDDGQADYQRDTELPAPTVTTRTDRWSVTGQRRDSGPGAERDPRGTDEPSYTIRANGSGSAPSGVEWVAPDGEPITDGSADVWETRPATTLVSSFRPDVVAGPGRRNAGDGPRQAAAGSVRVTVEKAACLQTFPSGYPWQGSKSKRFQQVGNAIPPLLAWHVLTAAALADTRESASTLF